MLLIQKELLARAQTLPDFVHNERDKDKITAWADGYCAAVDAGDDSMAETYMAALMLKFWSRLDEMYVKCKALNLTKEDLVSTLFECINVACKYRAWQKPGKNGKTPNAQACINQTISSRGAAALLYESNHLKSRVNVNTISLDHSYGDEDGTPLGETLIDEDSMPDDGDDRAKELIQMCINKNKVVEAIILDTIAFMDCESDAKVGREVTDSETGETYTVKYNVGVFKPNKCVKVLSALPEDYAQYFSRNYAIATGSLDAALTAIRKANTTKLHKYLNKTLEFAREDLAKASAGA